MLWTHGFWCLALLVLSAGLFGYWLREWLGAQQSDETNLDEADPRNAYENDIKDILSRLSDRDTSLSNIEELLKKTSERPAPTAPTANDAQLDALNARIDALNEARALTESRLEASHVTLESRDESLRLVREECDATLTKYNDARAELEQARETVARKDRELSECNDLIVQRDERVTELNQRFGEQQAEIERLRSDLAKRIEELDKLSSDSQWHQTELENVRAEVVRYENESAKQQHELDKLRDQVGVQEAELDKSRSRLADAQHELATCRTDLDSARIARDELAALHDAHRELESLLSAEKLGRADERRECQDKSARMEARIAELEAQKAELEAQKAELEEDEHLATETSGARKSSVELPKTRGLIMESRPAEIDNLKAIHGVGPKLEKMLHRIGIYTFKQVACWTDDDIDHVDSLLADFHGRIRRDDWVASAKRQHQKKYDETL